MQRGFTLLEALIAILILGLVGVLTYGTFARAMDARDRAETITTHYHQIRQATQRMGTEIAMAFLSAHKDCQDARTDTVFKTSRAAHGSRLDFTAFAHYKTRADANESDQAELAYFVERAEGGGERWVLMRREQARIDEEPDAGGVEQVLAENVTDLRFEFYDDSKDTWEDEWDSTRLEQKHRLPMFVSIKLTTLAPNGDKEEFVTKTRIFLKKRLLMIGAGSFAGCPE